MGIRVGGNQGERVRLELHNRDGSYAGSISYTKTGSKTGGSRRKKRFPYNFKAISVQLMAAKSSAAASQVAGRARRQVVDLLRRQALCRSGVAGTGDYDEDQLESALAHAKSMARIAKKRVRHLRQEEALQNGNGSREADEAGESFATQPQEEREPEEAAQSRETEIYRLKKELEELEQTMRELDTEAQDGILETLSPDASAQDLEQLKRKHRNRELREIMEADMKYLRSLFDRLAREQKSGSGAVCGAADSGQGNQDECSGDLSGVSLELSGMDVPVECVEMPVAAEGAHMDVTV